MANGNGGSQALTLKTARDLLESRKGEIAKALVNRIDPEAFIRVAHMAIHKNPRLLECTPASLLMALLESASLGLMPNGVLGHAYIIPYKNKGVMEAQFQPGYRGLIDLARRSGDVKAIIPRTVTSSDRFDVEYGLDEKLVHVPDLDNPGDMRFVYAVAHMRDGSSQFHIMPIKDVERIRARSRAANDGPWVTDYEAMAWKTVIKQLIKFLPLSLEADTAVQHDNAVEFGGDPAVFSTAVPVRAIAAPETRTQALRGRLEAPQLSPPIPDVVLGTIPPGAAEGEFAPAVRDLAKRVEAGEFDQPPADEPQQPEPAQEQQPPVWTPPARLKGAHGVYMAEVEARGWTPEDRAGFEAAIHAAGLVTAPRMEEWKTAQEFREARAEIEKRHPLADDAGEAPDAFGE